MQKMYCAKGEEMNRIIADYAPRLITKISTIHAYEDNIGKRLQWEIERLEEAGPFEYVDVKFKNVAHDMIMVILIYKTYEQP